MRRPAPPALPGRICASMKPPGTVRWATTTERRRSPGQRAAARWCRRHFSGVNLRSPVRPLTHEICEPVLRFQAGETSGLFKRGDSFQTPAVRVQRNRYFGISATRGGKSDPGSIRRPGGRKLDPTYPRKETRRFRSSEIHQNFPSRLGHRTKGDARAIGRNPRRQRNPSQVSNGVPVGAVIIHGPYFLVPAAAAHKIRSLFPQCREFRRPAGR